MLLDTRSPRFSAWLTTAVLTGVLALGAGALDGGPEGVLHLLPLRDRARRRRERRGRIGGVETCPAIGRSSLS